MNNKSKLFVVYLVALLVISPFKSFAGDLFMTLDVSGKLTKTKVQEIFQFKAPGNEPALIIVGKQIENPAVGFSCEINMDTASRISSSLGELNVLLITSKSNPQISTEIFCNSGKILNRVVIADSIGVKSSLK